MAVRKQTEKQNQTANKKKASATKKTTRNTQRDEVTEKERIFIETYLETGNGLESVRRAGYKFSTDASGSAIACRLLKRSRVKKEIDSRHAEIRSSNIATAQEVMEYFTKVMHGEIKDQFGLDAPLSERTRAAQELAKRTVDIDNRNKGQADAKVEINLNWKRD